MTKEDVSFTVKCNLCCGCGVCVGICPKKCISWEKKNGMYLPQIERISCIQCGICAKVCPGLGHVYRDSDGITAVLGNVLESFNAWNNIPEIRHRSASGGIVTAIVSKLMRSGEYDAAFMLDTYDYHRQLYTSPIFKDTFINWDNSSFQKSRYLPVSHEKAVCYIKEDEDKKAIFIGTSCAIRGLQNVISSLNRSVNNYLFIGLFCDRVFNYNIVNYYQNYKAGSKKITDIHFKNKESGGWPGNMKIWFSDGSCEYWDKRERTSQKDYFMPERCLYCIDKLNVYADISVGDNYTKQNSSELGSNSVIIRTNKGLDAWNKISSEITFESVDPEKILASQYIDWRLNNECYAKHKEKQIYKQTNEIIDLNQNINIERNPSMYKERWINSVNMLHAGEIYLENPGELEKQRNMSEKRKNPSEVKKYFRRFVNYIKRKVY